MASRRMVHGQILSSDSFLSLPFSAQMLYIQISMAADDDGFYNGPERMQRFIGARKKDLTLLIENRFLLRFGSVVVVKHWRMANSLKNDRLKPLTYPEIAKKIYIKPNRAYTDHPVEEGENLFLYRQRVQSSRNPHGIREDSQEKGREEKETEEKIIEAEEKPMDFPAAAARDQLYKMDGELGKGVLMLSEAQIEDLLEKMDLDSFNYYTDKLSAFILKKGAYVKNHYETLLRWWQEDRVVRKE